MMEATSVSACANTLLICLHIRVPAGQMQQLVSQNRNCQGSCNQGEKKKQKTKTEKLRFWRNRKCSPQMKRTV